ncbi:FkbM family methyltransferase [Pseudogemmobacter sonorensis]|uniref:FkbM family methyltransferase n=1 Tax=Pseudogemmobacter sonorensis TaxID=2989681 RepID=UPI003692D57F
MARFELRGLVLELPDAALRGGLERALASGRYENTEADAILRHLRAGDRFLDLGAGLGYLCALAAREIGAAAVAGVEAGPETLELARANLARNGYGAAALRHGAVTAGDGATVDFLQRPAFWASALRREDGEALPGRVVAVPVLDLAALLAWHRPTVLSCDIEGAEIDVLTAAALATPEARALRVIVAEIHPRIYGGEGVRQLFDAFSAAGFAYTPEGSRGATVVWERIAPPL